MTNPEPAESAQGSLRILSPADLLELLAAKEFSGRLVLISAAAPRRVVAVHLANGRPMVVIGTGLGLDSPTEEESDRARQALLEALCWTVGTFRIEADDQKLPEDARGQALGSVPNLLHAARERARIWSKLQAILPAPFDDLFVSPGHPAPPSDNRAHRIVLETVKTTIPLAELAPATGLDDHVALQAAVQLHRGGALVLGTEGTPPSEVDPALPAVVGNLLTALQTDEDPNRTLKIVVLSWDGTTCYRAVEALTGRDRTPPADLETHPRYRILHEAVVLPDNLKVEILAFRADTFEPAFAAPLVQDSHLFLLFTDIDAGHLWGQERPLIDRINELRSMFRGSSAAGRITLGAGAVTDPGCDVVIPELARYLSWSHTSSPPFLLTVLSEVAARLGSE